MKALIQRVKKAKVIVENQITGEIDKGILVLLGITHEDENKDADYLVEKIINLRIFESEKSGFDFSLLDEKAELLVVSQFTLYGSCKKGRRPDFTSAAAPEKAKQLYEYFIEKCKEKGIKTETGIFGAHMEVELINDGPVTLEIES